MAHKKTRRDTPHIKKEVCRVRSVYDGDTLTVEWVESSWLGFKRDVRPVKVRLAYIDTPELREKQAGALQAKEFLARLVHGKRVIVEYEELAGGGARRGRYSRLLAVVHLQRDFLPNINVNKLLLKKGLARLYSTPDNITPHHWKALLRAERFARRHKHGIWRKTQDERNGRFVAVLFYLVSGMALGILIGIALS